MPAEYEIAENVPILRSGSRHVNIYVTNDFVYIVPLDKLSSKVKWLRALYFLAFMIGIRGGIIGAVIVIGLSSYFIEKQITKEHGNTVDELRGIKESELAKLPGHACRKKEIVYEETKGGIKVHLNDKVWYLFDQDTASNLAKLTT